MSICAIEPGDVHGRGPGGGGARAVGEGRDAAAFATDDVRASGEAGVEEGHVVRHGAHGVVVGSADGAGQIEGKKSGGHTCEFPATNWWENIEYRVGL